MHLVLDCPCEYEQRRRNEDGTNVCQRQSILWLRFYIVFAGQVVVDGINLRHDKPDGDEKAKTRTQVHEPYGSCVKSIELAVNGLEICIERVRRAEKNGLIHCHNKHNRLREQDAQRPYHRGAQFGPERSVVLAGHAV